MLFGTAACSKLYYLKEIDGEWRPGTISQGVNVIAFAQDNQVHEYRLAPVAEWFRERLVRRMFEVVRMSTVSLACFFLP